MSPARPGKLPVGATGKWKPLAVIAALVAYFVFFNWDRVGMPLAADDMMNLGIYFRPGPLRALVSQFLLWGDVYRPMGAAFYLPIYYAFGLHSAPYQAAITVIIAVNGLLLYHFARLLGCSRTVGALIAFAGSYHTGLTNLHYNVDMVYDVLCFFFYVSSFNYYAAIRRSGRQLRFWQYLVLTGLYLCALNSKEIAVTLPLVLIWFEWVYCRRKGANVLASPDVLRSIGIVAVALGSITALYVYGRALGPHALAHQAAYAPVFSLARLRDFQCGSWANLLFWRDDLDVRAVAVLWAAMTLLAFLSKRPVFRFCWFFLLISPLPIEFLVGRFQGCLYIPMAGWVVFAVSALAEAVRRARGALQALGAGRFARTALTVACVTVFLVSIGTINWKRKNKLINPAAKDQAVLTWKVIRQLHALNPRVPSHSTVAFLNDPFTDYDLYFIAQLFFRDRTLQIHLQRLHPLPEADLQRVAAIFDFQAGKLVRLK